MKKFVFLAVVLVAVAGAVQAEAADHQLRAGGGFLFEDTVWGGGAAFDIGLGAMPFALTPFFDYYKDEGVSSILTGANITYKTPVADDKATVYVGAGGGLHRLSGHGMSTNAILFDSRAGVSFKINGPLGAYSEVKYAYSRKDGDEVANDAGIFVGLSFDVGGRGW